MQLHIALRRSPPGQLGVQPLPAWKTKSNGEEESRALEPKPDPPVKVRHHHPALFTRHMYMLRSMFGQLKVVRT